MPASSPLPARPLSAFGLASPPPASFRAPPGSKLAAAVSHEPGLPTVLNVSGRSYLVAQFG